ncbi:uncharacterized protein RCO7_10610 [Rhynchosporium graminicola]|uniref:Antifungal protein n=1 Tax=Rhynchosporium graminicola TaxID=2792576 RepID=A0A1E1LSV3_9HELO|nr:uncharacterized protein RCO7_10610 [Rhynchosporium commune]
MKFLVLFAALFQVAFAVTYTGQTIHKQGNDAMCDTPQGQWLCRNKSFAVGKPCTVGKDNVYANDC